MSPARSAASTVAYPVEIKTELGVKAEAVSPGASPATPQALRRGAATPSPRIAAASVAALGSGIGAASPVKEPAAGPSRAAVADLLAFRRSRRQRLQVRKPGVGAASGAASPVRTVIVEKQGRRVGAARSAMRLELQEKAALVTAESSGGEDDDAAPAAGPMELDAAAGSEAALGFPQALAGVVDLTSDL